MEEVSKVFLKGEQIHLNPTPFSSPFSSGTGQDSPSSSNTVSKDRTPKPSQRKHPPWLQCLPLPLPKHSQCIRVPAPGTNKVKALNRLSPCPLRPQCLLRWNADVQQTKTPQTLPPPSPRLSKLQEGGRREHLLPKGDHFETFPPPPQAGNAAWAPSSCSQMYCITGTCSTDDLDGLNAFL